MGAEGGCVQPVSTHKSFLGVMGDDNSRIDTAWEAIGTM
jgi:hypothetical protein